MKLDELLARRGSRELSIDDLGLLLLEAGIVPMESILDGTFELADTSRRNRNHRANWADGEGVFVKQAGPTAFATESTLRNEAAFYAACSPVSTDRGLALVNLIAANDTPPLLILRLAAESKPLWAWRDSAAEPASVYAALGRGLGALHRFCAGDAFAETAYAKSLASPAAPWVTLLHEPGTELLRTCSAAQLDTLRIIQRETNLGDHLDRVAARLRPTHIIHADMKADNILVENGATIYIIDWELAQRGDPAWDVGGLLADVLEHWLTALAPSSGTDATAVVANSTQATRFAHGASLGFWNGYRGASGFDEGDCTALLSRSIVSAAAILVQHAFEDGQSRTALSNHAVSLLQVAVNLFAEPTEGAGVLFGLSVDCT